MRTREDIAAARAILLNEIEQRSKSTSLKSFLEILNLRFKKGLLNKVLMNAIQNAWEKPRDFILTPSTIMTWQINRQTRGHDRPLKKSKDYTIHPWMQTAFILRQKYPKETYVQLLARVNLKHEGVSYGQLMRYVHHVKDELGTSL